MFITPFFEKTQKSWRAICLFHVKISLSAVWVTWYVATTFLKARFSFSVAAKFTNKSDYMYLSPLTGIVISYNYKVTLVFTFIPFTCKCLW